MAGVGEEFTDVWLEVLELVDGVEVVERGVVVDDVLERVVEGVLERVVDGVDRVVVADDILEGVVEDVFELAVEDVLEGVDLVEEVDLRA